MLGLLFLMLIVVASFGAGYATRYVVSRRRRAKYLKWEPYLRPPKRPTQPPAFLMRPTQNNPTQNKGLRSVDGGRGTNGR
jgi:hypothetical protein